MERSPQGVTLTELLVVLSIVAILAVMAMPAFLQLMARHRLEGATEVLFGDLQLARLEAVRRDKPVTVAFQTSVDGWRWCYAISDQGACQCDHRNDCRLDGSASRIVSAAAFQRISLRTNFHHQQTAFTPLRGALHAGSAILHNEYGSAHIIVSSLGRIRICSNELRLYPAC